MKQVRSFLASVFALAFGLFGLAPAAMAAAPDVSAVVTEIEGAATPIGLIGAAVLIVMIGVKVWKWMRRAS